MITFENITQTKSVYTHFSPILLIPLITPYLKKADIPFKTLGWEDLIVDHQLTGEIQPIYKKNSKNKGDLIQDLNNAIRIIESKI